MNNHAVETNSFYLSLLMICWLLHYFITSLLYYFITSLLLINRQQINKKTHCVNLSRERSSALFYRQYYVRVEFNFLEWKFQPHVVEYHSSNFTVITVRFLSQGKVNCCAQSTHAVQWHTFDWDEQLRSLYQILCRVCQVVLCPSVPIALGVKGQCPPSASVLVPPVAKCAALAIWNVAADRFVY
jgi:hypothetical protein